MAPKRNLQMTDFFKMMLFRYAFDTAGPHKRVPGLPERAMGLAIGNDVKNMMRIIATFSETS